MQPLIKTNRANETALHSFDHLDDAYPIEGICRANSITNITMDIVLASTMKRFLQCQYCVTKTPKLVILER